MQAPRPLVSEGAHHSPEEFCLALKAARQRRGITLDAIAAETKVCVSHLAALERGDLRHWPTGLYRRTFFRGYVEMIGLPVAETTAEFVRLFPDDETAAVDQQPAPAALPLMLDASWHGPKAPIVRRALTAAIDAAVVMAAATALAWLARIDVAVTVAVTSVSYFTLATVFLGDGPAAWALAHRPLLTRAWRRGGGTPAAPAAEPVEEYRVGQERSWTTDARRVRPRDVPPRMRVRFKWS
jgi:hypothetical protein